MPKAKTAAQKPKGTAAIQRGEHSRYQIKSGWLAGTFVARAFPKPPTKARGVIAEATGATVDAALAALHDLIEAREIRRTNDRKVDPTTGFAVPSTEEFAEAVAQVTLSRPQRAMLAALSLADDEGLSEVRLAGVAGYKSNASANRALASAGLLIASYLSLKAKPDALIHEHDGTVFLGYRGRQRNDDDPGNWILHTELREAVRTSA